MSIVNILRNLEYEVNVSAGLITFSDGEQAYALDCTEENDALFFGKLSVAYEYDDVVTYKKVNEFNLSHNYKATKIIQTDNGYSLRSEFYFSDPDFIYESVGLYASTMRKAKSMLIASCQSYAEEEYTRINSLKVEVKRDSIPSAIIGEINLVSNKALGDTISVCVRVYCDNALMMNDYSPKDYSFIDRITLEENRVVYPLTPWELPDTLTQTASLRYEIWDEQGSCLSVKVINE